MSRTVLRAIGQSVFCLLIFGFFSGAAGSTPFIAIPARTILTNASHFTDRTKVPQTGLSTSTGESPATATNFYALGWDEIASQIAFPEVPDTYGAVSKDFCVTMLNNEVRVQTRTGQEIRRVTLRHWWTNGHPELLDFDKINDPRILYDPFHDRWMATVFVKNINGPLTNAGILVGVSLSSNPTNSWNIYRIYANASGGTNLWIDQPTIGYNKDWIVVHGNVIDDFLTKIIESRIWVFNKTNLYAGGNSAPVLFTYDRTNAAGGIIPAVTLDNSASTLYLVQSANGNYEGKGRLRLFSITGALGSETLNFVTNAVYIPIDETWADITSSTMQILPQKGTNWLLSALDTRIQNVIYRNGRIWCTHDVFLPTTNLTHCAVQWWCFNPTNGTVARFGRIVDTTGQTNYAFPSIAVNKFDDVLIGYSVFSTSNYPSAAYSFRAFFDQPFNNMRNGRILKAGEEPFTGHNTWGDYSATVVDPANDADFWTIQECTTTNSPDFLAGARWATWWGQIKVDFPANDYFTNATVLNALGGTLTNFTYRAGKETGETNHHANVGGASVWYVWTPTNSVQAVIRTVGSSVAAVLAVYTGSSVSNLTLVGSDYAMGGSKVTFNATANTTYRIAVDGYNGQSGHLVLNWSAPLAPEIIKQPQSTNVIHNANENVTFTIEAVGAATLEYQWRLEGTNIPNATGTTYTITNVQTNHGTNYSVRVTNVFGTNFSAVAGLFVHDNSKARLYPMERISNSIRLHVFGVTNRPYRVDTTTNLLTGWYPIHTNWTSFWFTNLINTNDKMRFYRAITNN